MDRGTWFWIGNIFLVGISFAFPDQRWIGWALIGVAILLSLGYGLKMYQKHRPGIEFKKIIRYGTAIAFAVIIGGTIGFQIASGIDKQEIARLSKALDSAETKSDVYLARILREQGPTAAGAAIQGAPEAVLGPIRLTLKEMPDQFEQMTEELKKFRADLGLREITNEELGLSPLEVPASTFYYVHTNKLEANPQWKIEKSLIQSAFTIQDDSSVAIEMHTRGDGEIHIIGYITESIAVQISTLDGNREHTFVLFPKATSDRRMLVSIPVNRIVASRERRMTQRALEITIR